MGQYVRERFEQVIAALGGCFGEEKNCKSARGRVPKAPCQNPWYSKCGLCESAVTAAPRNAELRPAKSEWSFNQIST